MNNLPVDLLSQACRIFLKLSYPGGENTIPPAKRAYLHLTFDRDGEAFLTPPVCQCLPTPGGGLRGYAFRLGSAAYPHLKLQLIRCEDGSWVFGVDTHDAIRLSPDDPEASALADLQTANRQLKEQIERAWEAEGLLTFNALLRRALT